MNANESHLQKVMQEMHSLSHGRKGCGYIEV